MHLSPCRKHIERLHSWGKMIFKKRRRQEDVAGAPESLFPFAVWQAGKKT
jgi:hypothetical protein